ncbi:MAG: TonB-dependent receptor, partial [Aquabacterium sp.]|uniref:TonB-dependent receptor domain-containing protein n=1 Tax=Aquabacterium sp. TaxID=1872578 RepID=UPI00120295BA
GVVPTSSVVGNDTRGYASVSIHDLGDAYTLVLLNGQRVAPFGGQLSSGALSGVDINTIPLAMVERIEVLTDGASALYGADALGGVVNIITRRDGDANEATIGWTLPKGGAREWRASAFKSVGSLDEQGQSLSLGASYMHRSALRATSRDYAKDAIKDFSYQGTRYRYADVQDATSPATIYDSGFGWGNPYQVATGGCPQGSYLYSNPYEQNFSFPLCSYNYAADIDLVPEQTQHSLMASYTREFASENRLQLDLLATRSIVTSHLAPVATRFFSGLNLPATSPSYTNYLSGLGVVDDPVNLSYRFVDLGRRGFEDQSDLLHLAARLDGRLNGWAWQAGLTGSMSQQRSDIDHAMSLNTIQRLFDDGFVNPVALPGGQTASELAAQQGAAYNGRWLSGRSLLTELQWQASRDVLTLPGGQLKWAVGANVRREALMFSPSLFAQGKLSDPASGTLATSYDEGNLRAGDVVPMVPSSASRYVWGAFSEWLAPVSRNLDLSAAVRADHDQLVGQAWTGKTAARWRPSEHWLWRASLGTGFRAPTLNQLTSPARSGGQLDGKECSADLKTLQASLGVAPCTIAGSYPLVVGSNRDLAPEKSLQASLGLKVEPVSGHTLGLDWWFVRITDRIGSVDAATAFAHPLDVPASTWTVVNTGGSPTLALSGVPGNMGNWISSGVDVDASVRRGSPWGLFDSQLRVTAILREDTQLYAGGPWASNIGDGQSGGATLKWKLAWRNSWIDGPWTHSLTMRYQSGYLDAPVSVYPLDASGQVTGAATDVRMKVSGLTVWDWQTSWRVGQGWQLTAGVINLLDTRPPLTLSSGGAYKGQQLGYDERYYDARGRMLTLEARLSF